MKKALCLMLTLLTVIALLGGCQSRNPNQLDYARYQTTEEEVKAQIEKYGKAPVQDYKDSEFKAGVVLVMVYPFALDYDYTAEDFSDVDCTAVREFLSFPDSEKMANKVLRLELSDKTRKGVLDAIEILAQREDVYSAWADAEIPFPLYPIPIDE